MKVTDGEHREKRVIPLKSRRWRDEKEGERRRTKREDMMVVKGCTAKKSPSQFLFVTA